MATLNATFRTIQEARNAIEKLRALDIPDEAISLDESGADTGGVAVIAQVPDGQAGAARALLDAAAASGAGAGAPTGGSMAAEAANLRHETGAAEERNDQLAGAAAGMLAGAAAGGLLGGPTGTTGGAAGGALAGGAIVGAAAHNINEATGDERFQPRGDDMDSADAEQGTPTEDDLAAMRAPGITGYGGVNEVSDRSARADVARAMGEVPPPDTEGDTLNSSSPR
jgi:uncharacterized protein YcfJ